MSKPQAKERILEVMDRLQKIFLDKSERYADAWWDDNESFRIQGPFLNIRGKMKRLEKTLWNDDYADRPLTAETAIDTAVYLCIVAGCLMDTMSPEELQKLEAKLTS